MKTLVFNCKEGLKSYIENLRNQMILTGLEHGLNSKEVLNISQELDELICQYQKLNK